MRDTHARLNAEIEAAQAELAATEAEIDRSARRRADRPADRAQEPRAGSMPSSSACWRRARAASPARWSTSIISSRLHRRCYGHQVGDEVLRVVSRALLSSARSADTVGRTGGDEFVVILPGATLSSAHDVADGMRAAIAASDLKCGARRRSPRRRHGIDRREPVRGHLDTGEHACSNAPTAASTGPSRAAGIASTALPATSRQRRGVDAA